MECSSDLRNMESSIFSPIKTMSYNSEYYKEYYKKNREKLIAKTRRYVENNSEHYKEYRKKRYADGKDTYNQEYHREYYQKNKEKKLKYRKEYYENNKDKCLENSHNWKIKKLKTDPVFKLIENQRNRIGRLLKNCKSDKTLKLIGCTIDELKNWLESQFTEGMSWDNYGEWHVDHIYPVSGFNLEQPYEQKIAFNWFNLQPLWAKDNLIKHDSCYVLPE